MTTPDDATQAEPTEETRILVGRILVAIGYSPVSPCRALIQPVVTEFLAARDRERDASVRKETLRPFEELAQAYEEMVDRLTADAEAHRALGRFDKSSELHRERAAVYATVRDLRLRLANGVTINRARKP